MALRGLNACARATLTDASRAAVLRGALRFDCLKCRQGARRHLLSEDVVRLQDFQQMKLDVAHRLLKPKDFYFDKVNQKLKKNKIILKEDLKLLLHLCQSAEDVIMARNVIKRYHETNHITAFEKFHFGPLFMRLCYELGLEELAAATLTDPALKGFFSDTTSFNIAIYMLFNKQLYERGLEVVGEIKKQEVAFLKDTYILACAACYKLNTSKAYQMCLNLLEEGRFKGDNIPQHAYCFAIALGLNQNDIEKAQMFYSQMMKANNQLCLNLKVLIFAMKGSMELAVFALSSACVAKTQMLVKKPQFSQEVVNVLRNKSAGGLWEEKVKQVVERLEKAGQITEQTLDDFLCHTPSRKSRPLNILKQERKISRRTHKSPRFGLLSE